MALGLFYITGAQAVHDTGAFELDGDATSAAGGAAPDDWDRVCFEVTGSATDCSTSDGTNGSTAEAWQAEPDLNSSIFTGGGSKDPQNITQWAWKDDAGGLPDKDNLLDAFAVRYSLTATSATGECPNGTSPFDASVPCEVIYFGSDRYDNSGDAHQAFWFLQDEVSLGSNKIGGGTGFIGEHINNDLLVISNFSNGGTTSTIFVYKWDTTCASGVPKPVAGDCGDANLRLLASSTSAKCDPGLDDSDPFCGIVNATDGTVAPWPYTDKSGNDTYLQGEFYEAGVNLSTLDLAGTCFSSVVSETRSSTSTTATLKDFVLESFDTCQGGLTTQVKKGTANFNGTVAPGEAVFDTATVTVTGASSPADATGSVTFYLCGPTAAATACSSTTTGVITVSTETLVDTSSPANANDGISGAASDPVNTAGSPLASGFWCFAAAANLTNYDDPAEAANDTTECFRVRDTTAISTTQSWLPQDSATITTGSGGAVPAGTVVFTLYDSANCTGTVLGTFNDATSPYSTNNQTSVSVSTSKSVSWSATFTPTDTNAFAASTTTRCERSDLTINNSASDFPPPSP